jgi:TM2 domain-containing membrane protein YozV
MFCRNCGRDVVATAEYCPGCGARPRIGNSFCNACGAQVSPVAEMCMRCGTRLLNPQAVPAAASAVINEVSPKSRLVTFLCCIFFGIFGVHSFYAGKVVTGIVFIVLLILETVTAVILSTVLALFTAGAGFLIFGLFFIPTEIWTFVDFIMILIGKYKDSKGMAISRW